jgi:hypothetical protein
MVDSSRASIKPHQRREWQSCDWISSGVWTESTRMCDRQQKSMKFVIHFLKAWMKLKLIVLMSDLSLQLMCPGLLGTCRTWWIEKWSVRWCVRIGAFPKQGPARRQLKPH